MNHHIPTAIQHIHLMGICGTGMASLAGMLQEQDFRITGSDQAVYPPMSTFLEHLGIKVRLGYGPENLNPPPDLVIVGNVITRGNPEAQELIRLDLPCLSMPQALGHFFLAGKIPLVITGTHGKTTTAALLASILDQAGLSPGFMVGGLLRGYERNYQLGRGPYFVIEGDEYDTAFFDKGPKFLHYRPQLAVLTSIEFDHADIYSDLKSIQSAFARFIALVPETGLLLVHGLDPQIQEIIPRALCSVETYGLEDRWDWTAREIRIHPGGTAFNVYRRGRLFRGFESPLAGEHNVLNTLALVPLLDRIGLSPEAIARGVAGFQGVHRRQEVRGTKAGVTVIDDFAHHPTAVRETIRAIRGQYPDRRLVAVFEPRTNTSRRRIFQSDYPAALGGADLVLVREPPDLAKIAAEERFSSRQLVEDLQRAARPAFYFPDTEEILNFLRGAVRTGDVVLIMSNGGFDQIHQRLLEIINIY
jgi:UDP-N-acetylmuramate: L-alanyl-gamma-D-glutamyl-meso-diaminopimelate ligase